jgi:hypothetical protein
MSTHQWKFAAVLVLVGCGTDAQAPLEPAGPAASAVPACVDVEAAGQTFAINAFTFKSFNSIQATVDGVATPVAVTTYLLGAPSAKSDGTLHAHTSHIFEFGESSDGVCQPGEDCFVTDDRAVLDPIDASGLFRLNTRADIAAGFGIFANARKRPPASVHGTILLDAQPVATWSMKGHICQS